MKVDFEEFKSMVGKSWFIDAYKSKMAQATVRALSQFVDGDDGEEDAKEMMEAVNSERKDEDGTEASSSEDELDAEDAQQQAQRRTGEDRDKDQKLAEMRRALDEALAENAKMKERLERVGKETTAKFMFVIRLLLTFGVPFVLACVAAYFYARRTS